MNDVDDSDHELTDEQRDKLRKAIGEIIGDFISTSWFSHAALASRQWKELVDEYKGKDTK